MKFEAVYIEWEDAIVYFDKWVDYEELKEEAKTMELCQQLGFIIEENDEYILLASRYLIIEKDNIDVGATIRIPKSQIRKRKKLNLK